MSIKFNKQLNLTFLSTLTHMISSAANENMPTEVINQSNLLKQVMSVVLLWVI